MQAVAAFPTLDAAGSAALAAGGIERDDPFVLARFGDGDLYCMKAENYREAEEMLHATLGDRPGRPPLALADGELWSPELRDALRNAWQMITHTDGYTLMLGDPRTSDFGVELYPYWEHIAAGVHRRYIPVHHETFWLRNEPQPELIRFCQAVRYSAQSKVLIGREELAPAAVMMDAEFLQVDPFQSLRDSLMVVCRASEYRVVLVAAGRGGKAMIAGLLDPERTVIDIGALFDPLYIANSRPRPGAPSDHDAEAFFSSVTGEPVFVSPTRPGRAYPG